MEINWNLDQKWKGFGSRWCFWAWDAPISIKQFTFRELSFPHLSAAIDLPLQKGKLVKHGQVSSVQSLQNDLYGPQKFQFLINPSKTDILFVLDSAVFLIQSQLDVSLCSSFSMSHGLSDSVLDKLIFYATSCHAQQAGCWFNCFRKRKEIQQGL